MSIDTKPKISFIIPVYNAEAYINTCIDSILNTTFNNFELILVNDGSTDQSGVICNEYAKQDNRIRLYNKKNGGVSSARNIGINNARGEYIWFVDADDIINFEIINSLLKSDALEKGYDLIQFGYSTFKEEKDIKTTNSNNAKSIVYKSFADYYKSGTIVKSIWRHIFRTKLILSNIINFDTDLRFGEDFLFTIQFIIRSNSFLVIDQCGYFYRVHSKSAMNRIHNTEESVEHIVGIKRIFELLNICNRKYTEKFLLETVKHMVRNYVAFTAISVQNVNWSLFQNEYNILFDSYIKIHPKLNKNIILRVNRFSLFPLYFIYLILVKMGRYK